MATNLTAYKNDLLQLLTNGKKLQQDLLHRAAEVKAPAGGGHEATADSLDFYKHYQSWYTESLAVIGQLLPNRLQEFESLYSTSAKPTSLTNYSIQHWLMGYTLNQGGSLEVTANKFCTQLYILEAAAARFKSSLFELRQLALADLFDSELDAAGELAKHGFLRGAGAICGVVLEKHLLEVCRNRNLPSRKKNPTIADLNELLKAHSVIEVKDWRFIQHLGDIRNLCGHNKQASPTKEDVAELIAGVAKVSKTVF